MESSKELVLRDTEMTEQTQEQKAIATRPQRDPSPEEVLFELRQREAGVYAASPLIPAHLREGGAAVAKANCMIVMEMAKLLDESPLTVMQNIYMVKGKAGWNATYMIARANKSGIFKDPIDWDVSGAGDSLKVTCYATVKATGKRVEATADMEMAKAEGWTSNSKYKSMPVQMLKYRSATFLVRCYCPQVMLGMQTSDEIEDVRAADVVRTSIVDLPEIELDAPQMPELSQ